MAKIARWVPPLAFGAVWTSLGVATEIAPRQLDWWTVVAPSALPAVAAALVVVAWPLRSWWLAVVGCLLVVLPTAPWRLDRFLPTTSYTTLRGYEMSLADELDLQTALALTPTREVLLPGLLLLAAALFGFLVRDVEDWAPLLGTGLGVLVFAVSDQVDRLDSFRTPLMDDDTYEPLHLPGYDLYEWPDLTAAAVCCGLLVWAFVRRDQVVAVTAVVFGGVVWSLSPPSVDSPGMQFLSVEPHDHWRGFWEGLPEALTPACVLLVGAALAHLRRERVRGLPELREAPHPSVS